MQKFNLLLLTVTLVYGVALGGADEIVNISREEFDFLKATVKRLENFAENQIVLNQRLESDIDKQRGVIHDLQDIISRQADQMQDLQDTILRQSDQMQELQGIISGQGDQIQQLQELSQQTEKVMSRTPDTKKRSTKIKRYTDNTVAFFATLSKASLDHLGAHQNIVFEDVITNIGQGYNNHQGAFVAPVSGLYLITASVLSRQDREFWADMVVNGTTIVRLNGRGTDGRHGSGAQTVIMALNKGDDVSIQNRQTDDDYWGDRYTSFGGFLIQELEPVSSIVG